MESKIRANAELVRTIAFEQLGVTTNYDEAGVRWLDEYINEQHVGASDELKDGLVSTLGSFLGECVRETYGGQWAADADSGAWFIRFSERSGVYPFNKVRKQLQNGPEESVLGFFTAIPTVFAKVLGPTPGAPADAKPWWKVW